jgi:two-component system, OmpR family, response regulator MprA
LFQGTVPTVTLVTQSVLVLDDDPRMAAFLDHRLSAAGYRVARNDQPDVVVASGLPKLGAAREYGVPVLLLTQDQCVRERVRALDAGADDVLGKPFEPDELVARVRALSRRGQRAQCETGRGVLRHADVELDQDTHQVRRGGRVVQVRNRAFDLLACFLRHPGRVLSRAELLRQVWGWEPTDEANVVEVTISHLRQALEAGGEPRLIHTVRSIGYLLR